MQGSPNTNCFYLSTFIQIDPHQKKQQQQQIDPHHHSTFIIQGWGFPNIPDRIILTATSIT